MIEPILNSTAIQLFIIPSPKENLSVSGFKIEVNQWIFEFIELIFFGYPICIDIHPIIFLITLFL